MKKVRYKKIPRRMKEVLQALADGEELVYEKGGGWWLGDNQTNGKIGMALIRGCCISQDSTDKDVEHWNINETGMESLREGWLYLFRK